MPPSAIVPTYLLHRATGQARVRIGGRDHYLGKYNSPESRQLYARLAEEIRQRLATDKHGDGKKIAAGFGVRPKLLSAIKTVRRWGGN